MKFILETNAKMIKNLFPELPVLNGETVTIRPLTLDDADGLRELTGCEEVYRYLPAFLFEKRGQIGSRMYRRCCR